MMTARRCLVIMVLWWIGLAGPARADDEHELPEDRQAAAKLFSAGEIAFKKADYVSAAQSFEGAYKAFAAPEIAFSAAQAYRLGNSLLPRPRAEYVKRAIELYELYVAAVKQGGRVGDAAAHLSTLRAQWRELEVDGAARAAQMNYDRTQLTVWSAAEGAVVQIDGKPATAYAYVDVTPGAHEVEVTAPGHYPYQQRVSVAKGAQVPVAVELRAKPAVLHIAAEPGAEVSIDGRPVALVNGRAETAAGKRWLSITRAGREPFSKELTLPPGSETTIEAPLVTTSRRKAARWVTWGAAGLFAITATATTMAVISDGKAVDQREVANQTSDVAYEKWRLRRDNFRTAAFIAGGITLATAATAAVLYFSDHPGAEARPFRDDEAPSRGAPQFTPMVLGDGAGISLQGAF